MDDSKIIDLFFERSEQAIVELSGKYGPICRKTAENILNNRLDAEECVNEAYLAVWNTVPPQSPDPLLTYLCRIVRNIALKKYHENTAVKRNSAYDVALDEIAECVSSPLSVEDEAEAKEIAETINAFLASLSRADRIMFVRRYWHADSVSDIAALFNKGEHYVSVRLSRIRKGLKQYMQEKGISI